MQRESKKNSKDKSWSWYSDFEPQNNCLLLVSILCRLGVLDSFYTMWALWLLFEVVHIQNICLSLNLHCIVFTTSIDKYPPGGKYWQISPWWQILTNIPLVANVVFILMRISTFGVNSVKVGFANYHNIKIKILNYWFVLIPIQVQGHFVMSKLKPSYSVFKNAPCD